MVLAEESGRAERILTIATFAAVLSACTGGGGLPSGARQALENHLDSLPGSNDHRITRAWQGVSPARESGIAQEIWCVEVELSTKTASDVGVVWIVMRLPDQTEWQVTLLAAMSSLWPYEACNGPT